MAENLRLVIQLDDQASPALRRFAGTTTQATKRFEQQSTGSLGRVQAATGRYTTQVGQAGGATQQFGTKAGGAMDGVRQSVTRMTGSFGPALKSLGAMSGVLVGVGAAVQIVKSAVTAITGFESAMANVSTLVDTSQVSMAGLRDELLKLPPALGSSQELAEGLYQTLSAGVEPAKAVAFVGEAAVLAKAGLTDTKTAVDILTTSLNAYGLEADQTANVSSALFKTVELGKTTMAELGASLGQAIPLAASLGVSIVDLNAGVATLTAGGLKTSEAVTAMRSAFTAMIQQADKFRAAGIDVKAVLAEDGLVGVMQRLQQVTGGNAEELRKFIPDVQGLTAVLALAGKQSEDFVTKQRGIAQAFRDADAQQVAFAKNQATVDEAWKRLTNSLDRLAQEVGPPVLTLLGGLLEGVTLTIGPLSSLLGGLVSVGEGLVRELNPALEATTTRLGTLGDALSETEEASLSFGEALGQGLASSLKTMTPRLGLAISAFQFLKQKHDQAAEAAAAHAAMLADAGTAMDGWLAGMDAATAGLDTQTGAVAAQTAALPALGAAWKTLGGTSTASLHASADAAAVAFKAIQASGTESVDRVTQLWVDLRGDIIAAYGNIPPALKALDAQMLRQAKVFSIDLGAAMTAPLSGVEQAFKTAGLESSKAFAAGIGAMEKSFAILEASGQATAKQLQDLVDQIAAKYKQRGQDIPRFWATMQRELRDQASTTATAIAARLRELADTVAASFRTQAEAAVGSFKEMASASDLSAQQIRDRFIRQTWPAIVAGGADMVAKFRPLLAELRQNAQVEAQAIAKAHQDAAVTSLDSWRKANDQIAAWQGLTIEKAFATDVEGITAQIKDLEQELSGLRIGGRAERLVQRAGLEQQLDILRENLAQLASSTPTRGFQHGGRFTVGGAGGPDSQRVAFRATPGEEVTITPPGGQGGGAGGPAPQVSQALTIGQVTITAPRIADADALVRELTPALRRAQRRGEFTLGRT